MLNNIKQDYLEMQFRYAFFGIKYNASRERCYLVHFSTLQPLQLTLLYCMQTFRYSNVFATFWLFQEKIFHACCINCCFKYHKYNYTLCCVKTTSRILQFVCYHYFEDLLAPRKSATLITEQMFYRQRMNTQVP